MSGGDSARRLVVSAAILLRPSGEILLSRRPDGKSDAGWWEFPGGKVEPGEDPRHALLRECEEELGCSVEVGAIYESIHVAKQDRDILLLFYLCQTTGEPRPMEKNELRWIAPSDLDAGLIIPPDRPLVERLLRERPRFRL